MDLPIILKDVSINRIGHILEIRRNSGYTITFIPSQGTVVVDISGWYFGKVAGLLGTYNNEQFDEMLTSEQRPARNVEEFAFSWAMPICRSRQNYAHPERKFHRCTDWFISSYSPFRSCFRQVSKMIFVFSFLKTGLKIYTSIPVPQTRARSIRSPNNVTSMSYILILDSFHRLSQELVRSRIYLSWLACLQIENFRGN